MSFYLEGFLWYLILLDSLVYFALTFTKKWHNKKTHWITDFFPFNKLFAIWYLILTLWLGFALWRMQLLQMWVPIEQVKF